MELGQIEAFERTAREGSFTRAAEVLNLTQPAVSTRIATLEAELGGPLFERGGRQLQLTPLGQRFLPYAERMLAVVADGLQEVRNFHAGRLGEVKIAAPGPFVIGLLVDVLEDFRQQHPTIDVFIRERDKRTILEMLYDGMTALGLVNAPIFDEGVVALARLHDPIRAVAAPAHPLAHLSQPIPMETIYAHTIFRVSMFPRMTAFIDSVVEQGRQGSGGAVIGVPMVMALRLVTLGQGMTFLPQSYVARSVEAGELVYLNLAGLPRLTSEPVLIALKNHQLDKPQQAFVEIFKARWEKLLVTDNT
ncbi:MAG: LysR family transcriptional regulator [Anaerolineae bacterium]|nr:LysR family transcriptional regulator [Anaerolineae bacterium]